MSDRRVIYWDRVRGPRAITAVIVATALGAGLVPFAPGTAGTLISMPLAWASMDWPVAARLLLWLVIFAAGVWAAKVFDELMRTGDNQRIVIDEVLGLGITAWTCGPRWIDWIAAFVLFRFFDILKPFPVRQMDRWSKRKATEGTPMSSWWGGFGVIADDMIAGFQGLAVILILQHFSLL